MKKIPVIVYSIKENKYYELDSLNHTVQYFNLDISSVVKVLKGELKQTKGYVICNLSKNFEEVIQEKLNTKSRRGVKNRLQVKATDSYGNSEIYESCTQAADVLGITKGTVSKCCKGSRKHKHFKFSFI